jgi:putative lipoic acid-binding regulatory protein
MLINMTAENESPLKFPCDFPIKAMGHAHGDFHSQVVDIVQRHWPECHEEAVSSRASRNGKYLSVTVTVHATSRAQLDAIYQDLTASDDVLMAL